MEPKKTSFTGNDPDSDAYIGLLLYKTGKSVKNFILWIAGIFSSLWKGLLTLVVFLMRNIVWILLGTVIGLGYGAYLVNKQGAKYYSEMIVKTNFNSSRTLYNAVSFLNALINNQKTDELNAIFKLTPEESKQLVNFSVEPVKSELIMSEIYKEQFLQNDRSTKIRQDTFWSRTIKYNAFKDALTPYDFPYHKISAVGTNPFIFGKLQNGIQEYISNNELLKKARNSQATYNEYRGKMIVSAIEKLDDLRQAYNERIQSGQPNASPGNSQINVTQALPEIKAPELALYDEMLTLNDELQRFHKQSSTEANIIEVFYPFNPVGQKISFFRQHMAAYSFYGFCISLFVLLFIALWRALRVAVPEHAVKNNADNTETSII
ncbi:MAG: hypothetical protein JNL51_01665 [Chitinophagaceae bacterium]|nr:hypothetical protein [Chitinophagaceae bacterium]